MPRIITWYRERYVDQLGRSLVYLTVNLMNKKVTFNTGVAVTTKDWDYKNERVKKTVSNESDLNLIISSCRNRINDVLIRYRLQNRILTPDLLKSEYERPSMSIDFLAFMESAINERKGEITDSSLAQHKAHLAKLREYRSELTFSELTEDFFQGYARYLKTSLANSQNTRHNSIKTIRTYINVAKRKGLVDNNALDRMPVKKGQTDRMFLDEEELKRLVDLYRSHFLPDNYQRVLRHYLFCCFTGIRISDLCRVRMEDIISNTLVLMPYKTKNVNSHTIRIPLAKPAREIIRDEAPYKVQGLIFSTYSEQRMRMFLKDILKHAKIQKAMSFHSSRHTFATVFLKRTKNLARVS